MNYLLKNELSALGLKSVGENVLISSLAVIIHPERITIGNNVRIDSFCLLSAGEGGIEIGNYCHIAAYVSITGKAKVTLKDYAALSHKVTVLSSTDDYVGDYLIGVTVPDELRNVHSADVKFEYNTCVGAGSVVMPGRTIGKGSRVAAMSFVNFDIPENEIWGGVPVRKLFS